MFLWKCGEKEFEKLMFNEIERKYSGRIFCFIVLMELFVDEEDEDDIKNLLKNFEDSGDCVFLDLGNIIVLFFLIDDFYELEEDEYFERFL